VLKLKIKMNNSNELNNIAKIYGRCMKCKSDKQMCNIKKSESNKKPAVSGTCIICNSKMFIIISREIWKQFE